MTTGAFTTPPLVADAKTGDLTQSRTTKRNEVRRPGLYAMHCQHCSAEFSARRIHAKYCSDRCRMAAKRADAARGDFDFYTCEQCKRTYIKRTKRTRSYCGAACRQQAYRDRKDGWTRAEVQHG